MQIVCLGTTGFHPNARRHTASLLIPEVGVVLDAGTGIFRLADYLATDRIDLFLSHAHLDHTIGLTYLLETFGVDAYDKVTIHATAENVHAVRTHLFAPALFPVAPGYQFKQLGDSCELPRNAAGDSGTMTTFPLKHPGGSIGMRLDWPGHSMAYVTDTTGTDDADYIEHIRGVDLLIHEANFPAGHDELAELTGHSCLDKVANIAAAADVGQLVITHVDPLLTKDEDFDLHEARSTFPNTSVAHDLLAIEF